MGRNRKRMEFLLVLSSFVVLSGCMSSDNIQEDSPALPPPSAVPTRTHTPAVTPPTPTAIPPTKTQAPEVVLDEFAFPYDVQYVLDLWKELNVPNKDRYFTYHLVNRVNREIPYEDRCGYHPGDLIIPLGSTTPYDNFNIDVMMPYSGKLVRQWTTEGGDDGFTFYLGKNGGEDIYLNIYHTNVSNLSGGQYLNQGEIFGSLTYTNNFGGWNETKVHLTLFNPAEDGGLDFLGDEIQIIDITSLALPITMQAMYQYNQSLLLTYQGDNWCNMTSNEKINILLEKYLPEAGFCIDGNIVTYCGSKEELNGLRFTQYKWRFDDRSIMLIPLFE